jgi:hypothetical protein
LCSPISCGGTAGFGVSAAFLDSSSGIVDVLSG